MIASPFSFTSSEVVGMNENRRKILDMLASGTITADEAERLLLAIDREPAGPAGRQSSTPSPERPRAKYLRVVVESEDGSDGPVRVNTRIPMQLLRAGVRLASLIPAPAREHVNKAMHERGIPIDLSQIKPENLEEIVDQLSDLTVDVDVEDRGHNRHAEWWAKQAGYEPGMHSGKQNKVKVRIFCE